MTRRAVDVPTGQIFQERSAMIMGTAQFRVGLAAGMFMLAGLAAQEVLGETEECIVLHVDGMMKSKSGAT